MGVKSSKPYRATIMVDDVDTDTWYVLVDLSNAAAYPHLNTDGIILKGLELQTEKASNGRYDIKVGVVLEADTTDATVTWIWRWCLEADGNAVEDTDRYVDEKDWTTYGEAPYKGLVLNVDNDICDAIVCNKQDGNQTALKTDAGDLVDAVGNSDASAGAGDLVVFVDEGTSGGTISVNISAIYDTI